MHLKPNARQQSLMKELRQVKRSERAFGLEGAPTGTMPSSVIYRIHSKALRDPGGQSAWRFGSEDLWLRFGYLNALVNFLEKSYKIKFSLRFAAFAGPERLGLEAFAPQSRARRSKQANSSI